MTWLITPGQPVPTGIGEPFGGGFFAGYISHTADSIATHALVVAPRATGATGSDYTLTTNLSSKTTNTSTTDTTSTFDGVANTAAMVSAGIADHPAANFCVNLSIGGFTDWYLPARDELNIAYFNLKPDSTVNNTFQGTNIYSVPRRDSNFTSGIPAQTTSSAFNTTAQAFIAGFHWSSSQASASATWVFTFSEGGASDFFGKTGLYRVRAFRRITL
jgi:hypothetical protein